VVLVVVSVSWLQVGLLCGAWDVHAAYCAAASTLSVWQRCLHNQTQHPAEVQPAWRLEEHNLSPIGLCGNKSSHVSANALTTKAPVLCPELLCLAMLCCAVCCSVLSIEPVPVFRAFMEYSSARNHLTSLIELIPAVVALDTHKTYTINAPLIAGKSRLRMVCSPAFK
jgi:hypothetical protein